MKLSPDAARVAAQWRYPVKSMLGEEIESAQIGPLGILGDRAFAILDAEDGKVASAKNPRKWPAIFNFRSYYSEEPDQGMPGVVAIESKDGQKTTNTDERLDATLSALFARPVRLAAQPPMRPQFECVSEPEAGQSDTAVRTVDMPEGTFFDSCVLHLLTTATLRRVAGLYPDGDFDVRRFRPNLVIDTGDAEGFVENDWIGQTISVGSGVRLKVIEPCRRCIMTTLPQGELPKDVGILRTVVQSNSASLGVRCAVEQGGVVHKGDAIMLGSDG